MTKTGKHTKAETLYYDTRYFAKKHIEMWGYMTNPDGNSVGFNRIGNGEYICTRTLNDIQRILNSHRKNAEFNKKYGFWNDEKYENETKILNMIESTIKNHRKILAEI